MLTTEGKPTKEARDLIIGDLVDLEGDPYADPDRDNPSMKYEYAHVAARRWEGRACVVVTFEGIDEIGFPPDHTFREVIPSPDR